ncbi:MULTISPECIES: L-rhamnose mutarotase [Sphingobacterium]|uniref:L-rhamnose mutarotase n=1 Tax=Sphingobacterium TaxID=28453 RepID=UPI000A07D38B|nr:L-rhamnose mutarotase [Sphingobacterium sp. Ag1]
MKLLVRLLILCSSVLFVMCKGEKAPSHLPDYEEHVFVVNIVDNPEKLKEYLAYHDRVWPEVEAGFKKAGYQQIALYRFDKLIVMTVRVPIGADLDKMGKEAEAYSPKCAEWNVRMNAYQQGVRGTEAGQKWAETKLFYEFKHN